MRPRIQMSKCSRAVSTMTVAVRRMTGDVVMSSPVVVKIDGVILALSAIYSSVSCRFLTKKNLFNSRSFSIPALDLFVKSTIYVAMFDVVTSAPTEQRSMNAFLEDVCKLWVSRVKKETALWYSKPANKLQMITCSEFTFTDMFTVAWGTRLFP